jgi:hypothetical protein
MQLNVCSAPFGLDVDEAAAGEIATIEDSARLASMPCVTVHWLH